MLHGENKILFYTKSLSDVNICGFFFFLFMSPLHARMIRCIETKKA